MVFSDASLGYVTSEDGGRGAADQRAIQIKEGCGVGHRRYIMSVADIRQLLTSNRFWVTLHR